MGAIVPQPACLDRAVRAGHPPERLDELTCNRRCRDGPRSRHLVDHLRNQRAPAVRRTIMLHRHPRRHPHLRSRRRALAAGVAGSLAFSLAACGADSGTATSPSTPGTVSTPGTQAPASVAERAGTGWIGGEPEWGAGADSADARDGDSAGPMTASPTMAASADGPAAVPPVAHDGAEATAPLRAGSVDDNADFAGFLDYLARYDQLGLPSRPFDPTGRIVATVTGANGLPVSGATVSITAAGTPVAELQTAADGQVIFLPAQYGEVQPTYTFATGATSVDAAPGAPATLAVADDGGAAAGMPVDVLFLLDVTGSMVDEIAQLKATIADVSDRLVALPQAPDIRFGMTLFRDEGDAFVTSTYDFTGDIGAFRTALDAVEADGGGDTPEAVDEAFAAALAEPSWRDPAATVQLVFLVGDAAPQVSRQVEQAYPQSIAEAARRGITVHAVAASSTDDEAEHTFREIAQGTGGRFVFLAYGAAGTATGEHTDIDATDYEELSLDQLVVRLVGEELAALTGEAFTPPVPTVPDTVPTTQQ